MKYSTVSAMIIGAAILALALCLIFTGGCAVSPPPIPGNDPQYIGPYRVCSFDANLSITNTNMCGTMTVDNLLPCAECSNAMGCVGLQLGIYCAIGDCNVDTQCRSSVGNSQRPKR